MASISRDVNGNRAIQFVAGDRRRRTVRLGKIPLKAVREIKTKIEASTPQRRRIPAGIRKHRNGSAESNL